MRKIKSIREVVLNVRDFFILEKQHGSPIIPVNKVQARVAAATGFSIRCVTNFVQEAKLVEENGGELVKERKIRSDKIVMDEHGKEVLRRKIQEFNLKKEKPTMKKLAEAMKEEIDFKGGPDVLRKIIVKMGYRFQNAKTKNVTLIECANDIVLNDAKCSKDVQQSSPNKSITGSQTSPNTDSKPSASSSSQITPVDKTPTSNSRKDEVMNWLMNRNISFTPEMTRAQLLELAYRYKQPEAVHAVECILKQMDHEVFASTNPLAIPHHIYSHSNSMSQ